MVQLRRDQPTPLYHQLELLLRRAIEHGEYPDGRLPNEAELAARYQVSRLTVRSALRRLENDGLIERHRARGTFVAPAVQAKLLRNPGQAFGFEDALRRNGGVPTAELLSIEEIDSPAAIAALLRVPAGERIWCVRRLGRIDGEPLWLVWRYYPHASGAQLAERELSAVSISGLVTRTLGQRIATTRARIDATVAGTQQARLLGVREGHPLLVYQAAAYDPAGQGLFVVRSAFRGDRYALALELPQSGEHDPLIALARPALGGASEFVPLELV